jgi:hypothetical protein
MIFLGNLNLRRQSYAHSMHVKDAWWWAQSPRYVSVANTASSPNECSTHSMW